MRKLATLRAKPELPVKIFKCLVVGSPRRGRASTICHPPLGEPGGKKEVVKFKVHARQRGRASRIGKDFEREFLFGFAKGVGVESVATQSVAKRAREARERSEAKWRGYKGTMSVRRGVIGSRYW